MFKEFFGFGGFEREAEGFLSWQHITFVSCFMLVMILCALFFAGRNRDKSRKEKNRVLMAAALLMDGVELIKLLCLCLLNADPMAWLNELPLYLCSIQLISLPLAAFSRGRIKEAALDFVAIFGLLGAVMGTYCAGNNYACYPVLSFENVFSAATHSIAGFAALYILLTSMAEMKRENAGATFLIIAVFCIAAYIANLFLDTNYMFLMGGDGTPYDLLYSLVSGNPVLYPLGVAALFILYILLFYQAFRFIRRRGRKQNPTAE